MDHAGNNSLEVRETLGKRTSVNLNPTVPQKSEMHLIIPNNFKVEKNWRNLSKSPVPGTVNTPRCRFFVAAFKLATHHGAGGRAFIRAYYAIIPTIAKQFDKCSGLRICAGYA